MKKIILTVGLSMIIGISANAQQKKATNSNQPNYKAMSINYVTRNLKSPSTARVVQYEGFNNAKAVLEDSGFYLSECNKATIVVVDAQNVYGAFLRKYFFVFFKNGKPCHMEDVNSLGSAGSYGNKTAMLNAALNINDCGCK